MNTFIVSLVAWQVLMHVVKTVIIAPWVRELRNALHEDQP